MSITEVRALCMFRIGDVIPQAGVYICVPCGFMQYFEADEQFRTCDACLARTEYGPEGFQDVASESWQFAG